jgi:trigger factor
MNIVRKDIDALNTVVNITLEPADYNPAVEKAIKDHSKQVKMPGFRQGMVPPSHIKKLYGKSILVEEINKLLADKIESYINDQNLQLLGQPLPMAEEARDYQWDYNDTFSFDYEIGLAPEIKVSFTEKDKFTAYQIVLDKETLEERKKNLRRSYGKMTNPEVSAEGDVIYGHFEQLDQHGEVLESGVQNTGSLRLDQVEDKKILKQLIGLKKDDVLSIDILKALNNAHRVAHVLNIAEDIAKDLKTEFKLTVKNINRLEEAELNQDFFDKVYGKDVVTNEAEFEQKIKEDLSGIMQDHSDKKLHTDIIDETLKKLKINLPDSFLKKWLQSSRETPISTEELESQYPNFAKNLAWTLIENKIMSENDLKISQEEVVELAKDRIRAQFMMYSPTPIDEGMLNEYTVNFLQNRDNVNRIYDELRGRKSFDFIKSKVTLKKEEIEYKKFLSLN